MNLRDANPQVYGWSNVAKSNETIYAFNTRTIFIQQIIYIFNEIIALIQRIIYTFNERIV